MTGTGSNDAADLVLALDLGGTNMRVAVVSSIGKILSRAETQTPSDAGAEELAALVAALCRKAAADAGTVSPIGLGAAVPATFRPDGTVGKLPNLPRLSGSDIKGLLARETGLCVELMNDATAAAAGEHWLGSAAGAENAIMITLGTGVGGGIIIGGKVHFGADGTAGEIGHLCVEPEGHPCGCGSRGCLEQYASGTAVVRQANESGVFASTAKDVYDLADRGDLAAGRVFLEMGRYLGIAIGGLLNVLDPDVVVIGGGVAAAWDRFYPAMRAEATARAFPEPAERAKIARASLGDDPGVLGAAKITFERIAEGRL